MFAGIAFELLGKLFGGGHAGVGEDAAGERAGEISVENDAGEVGAIGVEQVEVGAVGR